MKKEQIYAKRGKEIYGLALMILSALILIFTVFDGFLEPLGAKYIKSFIMGVFGFAHYAFFVSLFSFGFIIFKRYTLQIPKKKLFGILGMFFTVLLILHLISSTRFLTDNTTFSGYISKCYEEKTTFGGIILGVMIYPVFTILKIIGSYILYACLFIIFSVTIIDFGVLKNRKTKNIISNTQKNFYRTNIDATEKGDFGNSLFISTITKSSSKNISKNDNGNNAKKGVKKLYGLSRDYYNALDENKKKYGVSNTLAYNSFTNPISGQNIKNLQNNIEEKLQSEKKEAIVPFYQTEVAKPNKILHDENTSFAPYKKTESAKVIDAEKRSKEISDLRQEQEKPAQKQQETIKPSPVIPKIIDGDNISQKIRDNKNQPDDDSVIKEFKELLKKGTKNQTYNHMQIDNGKNLYSFENQKFNDDKKINNNEKDNGNGKIASNLFSDDYYKITPPEKISSIDEKINNINIPKNNTEKKAAVKTEQIDLDEIIYSNKPVVPPQVKKPRTEYQKYVKPPIDLLQNNSTYTGIVSENVNEKIAMLEQVLDDFKTPAKVIGVTKGPAVTRYELQMPPGISVKRIADKADDIAYIMASNGGVRIETPIPGKQAVGIEIPNNTIEVVSLRELIESRDFGFSDSPLLFALGKDIAGKNIVPDLLKMPHLLVAGATNSGKSSCLNSLITSIIFRSSPRDVRFILVDPKRVEFTSFKGLPHLLLENPITQPEHALNAFEWAIDESENRFELFVSYKVRDINDFNNMPVVKNGEIEKLPYIVIVVDELADLMAQSKRDFEDKIRALAQKSRAAGIHLVLATQRPSVDVITGTIKANLPSRIAFSVTSFADSKTILDQGGAEKLLGRGDMLYAPVDKSEPFRVQGAYVTNDEVFDVVNFIKENNKSDFDKVFEEKILTVEDADSSDITVTSIVDDTDPNLANIIKMFLDLGQASTTLIQRRFRYGYAKAARIMDQLELKKYISSFDGTNKPRKVLITREEYEREFGTNEEE